LVKDPRFAVELLNKLKQSAKKWNLMPHNVENDEAISRLAANEPDLMPLYTAQALHTAASAISKSVQVGSWLLTNLAGFGGILNVTSPDKLRDIIVDGFIDYL
jgi:hypothetical protein